MNGHTIAIQGQRVLQWVSQENAIKEFELILALAVGWSIWHMPPSAPLDENGVHFLATLSAAVLMWLFDVLDDYLVGLILLLSWLVMGVVPTEVALAGFSTSSWFFVVGALGIGAAVNHSGVLNSLAIRLLRGIRVNHKLYKLIFAASGWVMTPLVPEVKARTVRSRPSRRPLVKGSASSRVPMDQQV